MENQLGEGKSFWEKPQGTPGMIGIALLICGAGYLVLKNAAWLALAMSNLTTAVFMGLGLFSLVWLLSDKKVRMLIWYFYKSLIEKITGVFIEINPIGIIKVYISELKEKRRKMSDQLTKLKAEKGKIDRKIQDTNEEMKNSLRKAKLSKEKGVDKKLQAQTSLYLRKAGRRQKSSVKLSELSTRMGNLYKIMDDMYYYSGIMIDDTSDQVEQLEAERNAIHASYSVMKSAEAIINGNSDEADMFDRAMQSVADDIGSKLGEMDRFMDMSENFMQGVDLDNGVFEMEGLEMLNEWEDGNSMKFLNEGSVDYIGLLNGDNSTPVKIERNYQGNKEISNKTNFFN